MTMIEKVWKTIFLLMAILAGYKKKKGHSIHSYKLLWFISWGCKRQIHTKLFFFFMGFDIILHFQASTGTILDILKGFFIFQVILLKQLTFIYFLFQNLLALRGLSIFIWFWKKGRSLVVFEFFMMTIWHRND